MKQHDHFSMRLDNGLKRALADVAKRRDESSSAIAREALRIFFEDMIGPVPALTREQQQPQANPSTRAQD